MKDSPQRLAKAAWWIVAAFSVGLAAAVRKIGDFDLPWHLAFGRLVVDRMSVPATDDLAYTQRPIEHAELMSDVFLYGVVRHAGPLGLQVLGGIVVVLLLGVLAWAPKRGEVAGPLVACSAAAAASAWLIVRPATFSFVLIGLVLLVLEIHRTEPASRRGRWALWSLVPLHVVWANVHGFVVVGLTMVMVFAAYSVACAIARGRLGAWLPLSDGGQARFRVVIACGSLCGSMINIAGPRLLLGPLRAMPDTGRVSEWAPTTLRFLVFDEPVAGAFLLIVVAALVLGRDPDSGRRTPTAWDVSVVAVAAVLAASAVRLVAVGAILCAPTVARRLTFILPSTPLTRTVASISPLLLAGWMLMRPGASLGVGFEPDHFPEQAIGYIRESRPAGRMWNSLVYGGYLAWRLHPEYRVLVDGRTGWVHDPRIVTLAHQSERDAAAFEELVREFDIQWAVTRSFEGESFGGPLAASRDWTMVFWDDVSAVYVRNHGPNAHLVSAGYRLLRHRTAMHGVLELAMRGDRAEHLTHDAELAARQAPESPRAAYLQGCAALGRRDSAAFDGAIGLLRVLTPLQDPVWALERAWEEVVRRR